MGFLKKVGDAITKPYKKTVEAFGSTLNRATGLYGQMDKSYAQQLESMRLQNAYNQAMWNMQNDYNSPSAQLARMRDAGIDINPTAYALGSGNLSNTASTISSENGFAGSGTPAGNPISMLMGMAEGIQGIRSSQQSMRESAQRILTQYQGREESVQRIKNMNATLSNIVTQGRILKRQDDLARINTEIGLHNLGYAMSHNKPVGFTPTVTSDPIGYGAGVLGDIGLGFIDAFSGR